MDKIVGFLEAVILLLIPFNMWAAYKLRQIWKNNGRDIGVLKERYRTAAIMAIASVMWGFAIFRRDLGFPVDVAILLLLLAAIFSSIPAAVWIYLYYKHDGTNDASG